MKHYRSRRKRKQKYIELFIFVGLLLYMVKYDNNSTYTIIAGGVACLVFIVAIIVVLSKYIKRRKKKLNYINSDIHDIDNMTGAQFEEYLKAHFVKQGYRVNITPSSNDYGADLIMHKNGVTSIVQAKRYKDKVGIKAIQEIIGAMGYYNADKCMIVTNSYFTANAKKLADANNAELWDRNKLIDVFQIKKGGI